MHALRWPGLVLAVASVLILPTSAATACGQAVSTPSRQLSTLARSPESATPSLHARELAASVLAASGVDKQLTTVNDGVVKAMLARIDRTLPDARQARPGVLEAAIRSELQRAGDDIVQSEVCLYASTFSESELDGMLEFYRSPAGRALVAMSPAIAGENPALPQRDIYSLYSILDPALVEACARVGCHSRPLPGAPSIAEEAYLLDSWAQKPSQAEMARLVPAFVSKAGLQWVDLRCRIAARGKLEDCVADSESYPGVGLGRAALRAVRLFALKPRLLDGTDPTGLFVQLTMHFQAGKGGALLIPSLTRLGVSMADLAASHDGSTEVHK